MKSRETANDYIYTVDKTDRIVSVSDNWLLFAQQNQAAESCHPDMIINRPIWDFISGMETQHIFEVALGKVRTIDKSVVFPFRCDSPDKRRYLELIITPAHQKSIEFTSYIIREESRDTVELLQTGIPRSNDIINMCSMCKKVELSKGHWEEIEVALAALKLFEHLKLPQISHGLCAECFALGMAEIEKLDFGSPNQKPSEEHSRSLRLEPQLATSKVKAKGVTKS